VPWKVSDVHEERMRFVALSQSGVGTHSALCAQFGVSRETGYKWLERYRRGGFEALVDASRAPHKQPRLVTGLVLQAILEARRVYPTWGPKKIRTYLLRERPELAAPAASTIGDVLRREGMVKLMPRREVRGVPAELFAPPGCPNAEWAIDFKGWFRTFDGTRCDPLTVTDGASRYLLACQITRPRRKEVQSVTDRLMREFGVPEAMRMDNGAPFTSTGAGGLTPLSVHWAKLGIKLKRIKPGRPQQNGRHERMHRTLKEDTSSPPAATCLEQQIRFDQFRRIFNEVRPHEGLEMATPASLYQHGNRPFPDKIEEPWYDANHQVQRVRSDGMMAWKGDALFLSEALGRQMVGLVEIEDGHTLVRFIDIDLGIIDAREKIFRRFTAPRSGRREGAQTQPEVSTM
jgi:putative transposase